MRHTIVVAKAIVTDSTGRVLLLRRSKDDPNRSGQWDFPGGAVEDDEDFKAAVVREIAEETGLTIVLHDVRLISAETSVDENDNKCRLFFIGLVRGQATVRLSPEHDKHIWVTLDQAIQAHDYERHRRVLEFVRDHQLLA